MDDSRTAEIPYNVSDPTDAFEKAITKLEKDHGVVRDDLITHRKNPMWHFVSDKVSKASSKLFLASEETESLTMENEIEDLTQQLKSLEERREKNRQRMECISHRRKHILGLKQNHLEKISEAEHGAQILREKLLSFKAKKRQMTTLLDAMSGINVMNDCFHIWYDRESQFATISSFRLAHKGNRIYWHETNSALGQAAMILKLVSDLMDFEFSSHVILPMGCYSKLAPVSDRRTLLPLYMEEGFYLMKRSNFNKALQAFLECLREAGELVEKSDPTLQLPLKIEGDKIGNYQVVLGNEDDWTRAMKYIATDLKWLVAWASKYGSFYSVKPPKASTAP